MGPYKSKAYRKGTNTRFVKKGKYDWLRHPLTLLLSGFFLTSILGTAITYCVGEREYSSRQELLYKEKDLEAKMKIIEEVNAGLGNVIASIEQLVHSAHIYKDSVEYEQNKAIYAKNILNWKYKSKSARVDISIFFQKDLQKIFDRIDSTLYTPSENALYITGISLVSFDYSDLEIYADSVENLCIDMMLKRNFINEQIELLSLEMGKEIQMLKTQLNN